MTDAAATLSVPFNTRRSVQPGSCKSDTIKRAWLNTDPSTHSSLASQVPSAFVSGVHAMVTYRARAMLPALDEPVLPTTTIAPSS